MNKQLEAHEREIDTGAVLLLTFMLLAGVYLGWTAAEMINETDVAMEEMMR